MAKMLKGLMRTIHERLSQIAYLMNKFKAMEKSSQVHNNTSRQVHMSEAIVAFLGVLDPADQVQAVVFPPRLG